MVPLLPVFNSIVFFIRLAGVVNSIGTDSAWKTQTLTDEKKAFMNEIRRENNGLIEKIKKLRSIVNKEPETH